MPVTIVHAAPPLRWTATFGTAQEDPPAGASHAQRAPPAPPPECRRSGWRAHCSTWAAAHCAPAAPPRRSAPKAPSDVQTMSCAECVASPIRIRRVCGACSPESTSRLADSPVAGRHSRMLSHRYRPPHLDGARRRVAETAVPAPAAARRRCLRRCPLRTAVLQVESPLPLQSALLVGQVDVCVLKGRGAFHRFRRENQAADSTTSEDSPGRGSRSAASMQASRTDNTWLGCRLTGARRTRRAFGGVSSPCCPMLPPWWSQNPFCCCSAPASPLPLLWVGPSAARPFSRRPPRPLRRARLSTGGAAAASAETKASSSASESLPSSSADWLSALTARRPLCRDNLQETQSTVLAIALQETVWALTEQCSRNISALHALRHVAGHTCRSPSCTPAWREGCGSNTCATTCARHASPSASCNLAWRCGCGGCGAPRRSGGTAPQSRRPLPLRRRAQRLPGAAASRAGHPPGLPCRRAAARPARGWRCCGVCLRRGRWEGSCKAEQA